MTRDHRSAKWVYSEVIIVREPSAEAARRVRMGQSHGHVVASQRHEATLPRAERLGPGLRCALGYRMITGAGWGCRCYAFAATSLVSPLWTGCCRGKPSWLMPLTQPARGLLGRCQWARSGRLAAAPHAPRWLVRWSDSWPRSPAIALWPPPGRTGSSPAGSPTGPQAARVAADRSRRTCPPS